MNNIHIYKSTYRLSCTNVVTAGVEMVRGASAKRKMYSLAAGFKWNWRKVHPEHIDSHCNLIVLAYGSAAYVLVNPKTNVCLYIYMRMKVSF